MLWRSFVFFYFETTCPKYNLDLRSYGQLFSLFYCIFNVQFFEKIFDMKRRKELTSGLDVLS